MNIYKLYNKEISKIIKSFTRDNGVFGFIGFNTSLSLIKIVAERMVFEDDENKIEFIIENVILESKKKYKVISIV